MEFVNAYHIIFGCMAAICFVTYIIMNCISKTRRIDRPGVVLVHSFQSTSTIVNPSPFTLKLLTFMRMAGDIAYDLESNTPLGPKNKTPWIELDDDIVSDSSFIIAFLTKRYNVALDNHLTEEQRSLGHAIQRTFEENTFWATVVYNRFVEDPDWFMATIKNMGRLVKAIGKLIHRRRARRNLYGQGMGRHSSEEVQHIAEGDLRAISTVLGDKPYLLGDRPSSFDAALFGLLANIVYGLRENSWPNVLLRNNFPNLNEYVRRIKNKYWQDWESFTSS